MTTKKTAVEELRESLPGLMESWEKLPKDELLEECCNESLCSIAMQERVSVFMEHCTDNLSKTTYSPEDLKVMIEEKQNMDIAEFCYDECCSEQTDKEIADSIRERAKDYRC